MNTVLAAIKTQLDAAIAYCKDSGYIAEDVIDLIKGPRFPFYSLEPGNMSVGQIEGIPKEIYKRNTYRPVIILGEKSVNRKVAWTGGGTVKGLYPFMEDVIAAIFDDRTLGGVVDDTDIGYEIDTEIMEDETQGRIFVAMAAINLRFYKDVKLV